MNEAIQRHHVLELKYYKENEDDFVKREVEPYQLVKGPEGWYLGCWDLGRSGTRHFRLDRMQEAAMTEREFEPREGVEEMLAEQEWLVHGEVTTAGVARVWVAPGRARWLREQRTVVEELSDGAVVVELPYGSSDWARARGAEGRGRPGRPRAERGARSGPESGRRLSDPPGIVRIVAPNPGPMTLEGTNTYVVDGYVIDPGPDDAGHLARVREAAGGEIAGVLLTHGHSDHSEGVEALGAELLWGQASGEGEMEAMRRALESGVGRAECASSRGFRD